MAFGRRGLGSEDLHIMAAVRPKLAVLPSSGADNVWSRTNSSRSDFLDLTPSPASPEARTTAFASSLRYKATASAQPSGHGNVKKMRRRVALLSGIHLNLPSSPIVSTPPPGSSTGTVWTFTAEWDSTGDGFILSELESSSSSGSSSASMRFFSSPVPRDVNEDEVEFEASSPLQTKTKAMAISLSSHIHAMASTSSATSTIIRSPVSPAVTDIFDLYSTTPNTQSFDHPDSMSDSSSAPSSPIDTPSPTDSSAPPSPPSDGASKMPPPTISVTYFEERRLEDQYVAQTRHSEGSSYTDVPVEQQIVVAPMSAFEAVSWASILPENPHYAPAPKTAGVVFKRPRPLPPVPVRRRA
ncbi:hypothetical protein BD309DRAFT_900472 [Dichomitus squalens]|nr:hypothetical protein BD309DRAFT_900472 [Dichomitus squalens]